MCLKCLLYPHTNLYNGARWSNDVMFVILKLCCKICSLGTPPPIHNTSPGKTCTGFPFKNVLNIKSPLCVSMLWMVLALLTSLNCYMSTLRHACWKSNNTNARLMVFALSLALDPTFEKHDGNLSHGKVSNSVLFARFQNPPFLISLAVLLNSPAGWMIALPS